MPNSSHVARPLASSLARNCGSTQALATSFAPSAGVHEIHDFKHASDFVGTEESLFDKQLSHRRFHDLVSSPASHRWRRRRACGCGRVRDRAAVQASFTSFPANSRTPRYVVRLLASPCNSPTARTWVLRSGSSAASSPAFLPKPSSSLLTADGLITASTRPRLPRM